MTTRKHRKASDQYPPAGPSAMPHEDRPICGWCGGRYVPGFWPWHAMWNHTHGPYTKGDWRDAMPPDVPSN